MSPENDMAQLPQQSASIIYRRIKQLLQLIVQPHFDGQPLADEAHLMWSVLGGEELLASLLHRFALLAEIDAQTGPIGRPLAIVQRLQTALHFGGRVLVCWMHAERWLNLQSNGKTIINCVSIFNHAHIETRWCWLGFLLFAHILSIHCGAETLMRASAPSACGCLTNAHATRRRLSSGFSWEIVCCRSGFWPRWFSGNWFAHGWRARDYISCIHVDEFIYIFVQNTLTNCKHRRVIAIYTVIE